MSTSLHRSHCPPLAVATPFVHSCLRYILPSLTQEDINEEFRHLVAPSRADCNTILHPLLASWLHAQWDIDTEILARPPYLAPAFTHHVLQYPFLTAHTTDCGPRAVCLARTTDPAFPRFLPQCATADTPSLTVIFLIGEITAPLQHLLDAHPPSSTYTFPRNSFPIPQPEMLAGTYTHQGRVPPRPAATVLRPLPTAHPRST